jgi:hypothetical protein
MVSPPTTSEAENHAAGDTKSEHFEPARVRKLNEKQFRHSIKGIKGLPRLCHPDRNWSSLFSESNLGFGNKVKLSHYADSQICRKVDFFGRCGITT